MGTRFARLLGLLLVSLAVLRRPAQAVEPDGTLIRLTTSGKTYRIVGGAPLQITNCNLTTPPACEGRKASPNLTRLPRLSAGRRDDRGAADNGTYRFAGGAPLWISTCSYQPTCTGRQQVDDGVWGDTAHYKAMPLDGTVIRNVNDGGFYRFAGGAPLLVRCESAPAAPRRRWSTARRWPSWAPRSPRGRT